MPSKFATIQLLLALISGIALAQEQLLVTGNTQLPACALQCTALNGAAGGCKAAANQWLCFCTAPSLTSLYTTPVGICDAFCPDAADNAGVMTWYKKECGTDDAASEHPAAGGTTTAPAAGTATTTGPSSTASGGVAASGTFTPGGIDIPQGNWWASHYQWVVMVIVIILGVLAITFLLLWLKRRHARKQDRVVGGFNEGITMRSTPMTSVQPVAAQSSSGRDSPMRTRDAFMPYGYGYSRSESRLESRTNVNDSQVKGSPLAHDGTTLAQLEKGSGTGGKKKRVYVRERSLSGRDSPEMERR